MDHEVRVRRKDRVCLCIWIKLKHILPCTPSIRIMKLNKIYEIGQKKMNKALNISTLIKTIRTNNILLENVVLNKEVAH